MIYELHLRTVLIAIGLVLLTAWLVHEFRARKRQAPWPSSAQLAHCSAWADRHYRALLTLLCLGFLLLSSFAKLSQLRTLSLHSEDFWLFEDMLAQMLHGGFFITRFAPQTIGWVQHGAVHPYLTWLLPLPLAWLTGPTAAALLFGPLMFTGAAVMLALIARPRWGALGALIFSTAFLASSQVGRVVMYDVHPEAAYPVFVFLWAWAAGWGDRKIRPWALLLGTVLLMGIKQDALFVLPPLILATALWVHRSRWLLASALLALATSAFQFFSVHQWLSGAWGPHTWQGEPVLLPRGAELLRGHHLDSPASAMQALTEIVTQKGGALAVFVGFFRFLLSRPWLSLLLVAPWAALQPAFWVSVLPLAGVFSLLDEPGKFINYYSAPLLGLFWLGAASALNHRKSSRLIWLLSASLVLGGAGLDFYFPRPELIRLQDEVHALLPCLPSRGKGLVTAPFLGLVPRERVSTDRARLEKLDAVDFYLFAPRLPSYEVPPQIAAPLLSQLTHDPCWMRLGPDCRPIDPAAAPGVLLFVPTH